MSKPRHQAGKAMENIAEQAQEQLTATADVAKEKVAQARTGLNEALEQGQEVYNNVREGAMEGAKVADEFIRKNPYAAVGIGVGVGLLVGLLLMRGRD